MRALGILGGIFVAGASVLAVTAFLTKQGQDRSSAGERWRRAPQIEFVWSLPAATKPSPSPQVAIRGYELPGEIAPVRHAAKRQTQVAAVHRSKRHHRHSEPEPLSASVVWEGSSPATPGYKSAAINEVAAVARRLRNKLNGELFADFQLFLYVSKAANGPIAQHMYVFHKGPGGALELLYDWPVSTGRDRSEPNGAGSELSTFTPSGYFELDSHRFFRHHVSSEWHESMPFAMFFDVGAGRPPTGLAIHAATRGAIKELGTRASAGCVRLAPQAAETLFTLIRARYHGHAPRFAVDQRTGAIRSDGALLHDAHGRPQMAPGYEVLVVIENYAGRKLVAAM